MNVRMKLRALVLLLASISSLTLTEVVKDFKKSCPSFFLHKPNKPSGIIIIIPTIFRELRYKQICQRWKKEYRFATMYDTEMKIPVYSAYTFLTKEKTERRNVWKIEPQLDNIRVPKGADVREMMKCPGDEETVRKITHQAVASDYNHSVYTRGHVFPCSFAADQDQADSTFTLTNTAPQTHGSNQEWAKQAETPMLKHINQSCSLKRNQKAYIVTGVVPGKNWLPKTGGQKYKQGININIPSHFWSAFCCTSKNRAKKLITKAYIAELENFKVRFVSIDDLNKQLTKLYDKDFSVFPGLPVEHIEPPF